MADKKNTEVPPASEPAAPVQEAAPVVVTQKRRWVLPLISALVVVAALVVGGIGGFAIATATQAGGRPAIEQGQFPGGPGQQGGTQQGPGQGDGQDGERPEPPSDSTDGDSTEG
ncbi:hypothetical protein [Pseudolysinimonas sp.]|jgi:hypothetical protein|uniref:hypothetical protein n=1 Tax=Pseudolysinimonas sp. TaxID=2680009 RepID=UPI003784D65B